MFPYRDENKTVHPAYVTYAIIVLNVLVWIVAEAAARRWPWRALCVTTGSSPVS
jgi:hypothetical protein